MNDIWARREDGVLKFHSVRVDGGRRLRLVDEKKELIEELERCEGTIYVPVVVHETAGDAKPYVKVTKEAAKDLVERKGALWWLNPLCGGKDALLEPMFVTAPGGLG